MTWSHKGMEFAISTEPLGPFYLAAARAPRSGPFVRIRPFSALAQTREEAVERVQEQIRVEYRSVPEIAPGEGAAAR